MPTSIPLYVQTAVAVAAYDRADTVFGEAEELDALTDAYNELVAAEQAVIQAWTTEAREFADATTAKHVSDTTKMHRSDWRFLRDVVLNIPAQCEALR